MFWFVVLCPALLPPVAVWSAADFIRQVLGRDIPTIHIGQLFQRLESTSATGEGGRGDARVRADILIPLHPLTTSLEEVPNGHALPLKVALEDVALVSISKETIQTGSLEIELYNRRVS